MSTQMTSAFRFRWRSWLGLAVALFLLYGALNFFGALFVPLSLHLNGPGAAGGVLVLSPTADAALLGRSLAELGQREPALGAYLVAFMDTMCAQMMSFAIVHLGVAWFALRRGERWALWTLLIGDLVILPYYAAVIQTFARFGVPPGDVSYLGGVVIVLVATALGWLGLRRGRASALASV